MQTINVSIWGTYSRFELFIFSTRLPISSKEKKLIQILLTYKIFPHISKLESVVKISLPTLDSLISHRVPISSVLSYLLSTVKATEPIPVNTSWTTLLFTVYMVSIYPCSGRCYTEEGPHTY